MHKFHPGGDPNWPSWRYGPNGESVLCQGPQDVPEGFKKHPSEHGKKSLNAPPKDPANSPAPPAPDRKEVMAKLDALGVAYKPRSAVSVLVAQLEEAEAKAAEDGGEGGFGDGSEYVEEPEEGEGEE